MSPKETFNHVLNKRISLDELSEYASVPASVAEDIISPNGAVFIPMGTKLFSMLASENAIKKNLTQWGISSIPITIHHNVDTSGLESMLRAAREAIPSIDPQLASETVKQVESVYERISTDSYNQEDITNLVTQGRAIAKEIAHAPQLMLCLGKVRSWDEYTYVHSLNVGLLSGFLAKRLFPNDHELAENVTVGGILHDLGKARIPKEILNKPGKLTAEEFAIMQKHTIYGDELAKSTGMNSPSILASIRGHHERCDGNGYPDSSKVEDIRPEARIAAVADVFDALTAKRVYKEPMDSRAAVSLMLKNMGGHFDSKVLRALLVSIGLYPPGTGVELSDDSLGVVVSSNENDLMRPAVLLYIDNTGHKPEDQTTIDLSKSDNIYIRRSLQDVGKTAF